MSKRENCLHRHANGNCLFNGGFCLANNEEHCLKIKEDDVYNQALEDFFNKCLEENIQFYLNPIDCMREVKEQLKK